MEAKGSGVEGWEFRVGGWGKGGKVRAHRAYRASQRASRSWTVKAAIVGDSGKHQSAAATSARHPSGENPPSFRARRTAPSKRVGLWSGGWLTEQGPTCRAVRGLTMRACGRRICS